MGKNASEESHVRIQNVLCDSKVYRYFFFSGFDADPKTSKFELLVYVPLDIIVGTYILNGKILLIPLAGRGMANFTFGNLLLP